MMTAEQNLMLLQEIDANRRFLLLAYRSNPALLARADDRIRRLPGVWSENGLRAEAKTMMAGIAPPRRWLTAAGNQCCCSY